MHLIKLGSLLLAFILASGCGFSEGDRPAEQPKSPRNEQPGAPKGGAPAPDRGAPTEDLVQITTKADSHGEVRTAMVHVPKGYDGKKAYPVIWVFHGGKSSSTKDIIPPWREAFDGEFILVFPEGQNSDPKVGAWFVEDGADLRHVDVIREASRLLAERYNVDAKRQFATGFSSGAHMTWQLACKAPDLFRAVAPVSHYLLASYADDCKPGKVPPLLLIGSIDDEKAPYEGDKSGHNLGCRGALNAWTQIAGCREKFDREERLTPGPATRLVWEGCSRAPVEHVRLEKVGHQWADGRNNGPDNTTLVLEFFRRHGL